VLCGCVNGSANLCIGCLFPRHSVGHTDALLVTFSMSTTISQGRRPSRIVIRGRDVGRSCDENGRRVHWEVRWWLPPNCHAGRYTSRAVVAESGNLAYHLQELARSASPWLWRIASRQRRSSGSESAKRSRKGGTPTVERAALLVTLPTELVTSTVNCAPLSDVDVAGVV